MNFAQKGFYVTKGGWKAQVIHIAGDRLVVLHHSYEEGQLVKEDLIIHTFDGVVFGSELTSSIDWSNLVGKWDESGVVVDTLHVVHLPGRLPQFELGSRIPNRMITDPAASLHKFQLNWRRGEPKKLVVGKLL